MKRQQHYRYYFTPRGAAIIIDFKAQKAVFHRWFDGKLTKTDSVLSIGIWMDDKYAWRITRAQYRKFITPGTYYLPPQPDDFDKA